MEPNLLLPARAHESLDDYLATGGGKALAIARERGATWVFDELEPGGRHAMDVLRREKCRLGVSPTM